MSEMTNLEIEKLKKLCEKACPGPWEADALGGSGYVSTKRCDWVVEGPRGSGVKATIYDAMFIAEARSALPRALDEIQRLQAKVAELTKPKVIGPMRLTMERLARGWSKNELARRAAMHPSTICRAELGRENPSRNQLEKIAAALGMSIENAAALLDAVPSVPK